jgi:hypothetical protein
MPTRTMGRANGLTSGKGLTFLEPRGQIGLPSANFLTAVEAEVARGKCATPILTKRAAVSSERIGQLQVQV